MSKKLKFKYQKIINVVKGPMIDPQILEKTVLILLKCMQETLEKNQEDLNSFCLETINCEIPDCLAIRLIFGNQDVKKT